MYVRLQFRQKARPGPTGVPSRPRQKARPGPDVAEVGPDPEVVTVVTVQKIKDLGKAQSLHE